MSTSNAHVLDCTTVEYLNDPCPTPSLTQSLAQILVTRSPLHAWLRHPRLGGRPRKATAEMDTGSLVHSLLLGSGKELVLVDANDWRTNAAKEARELARAEGKVAVLPKEHDRVSFAVKVIREKMDKLDLKLTGRSEVAIAWDEKNSQHRPVQCRAMLDHVYFDQGRIVDLKTIESADPRSCAKHAVDYGYCIQHAAYTSALGKLLPELAGRIDFVLVFAEVEEPYCVTATRLDGSLREIGDMHWAKAVELWSQCLRSGKWPPYAEEIITLEAPPWLVARELGVAI